MAIRHFPHSAQPGNFLCPGARRLFGKLRLLLFCVSMLLFGARHTRSQPSSATPSEYQVKAAFIYNFTKFIEWPGGAFTGESSPFVIGVVGKDPFGAELEKPLDGKTMNGRAFVIKRFKQVSDMQTCHILFVCGSEKDRLPKVMERVVKANTLVVGDMPQFVQRGGMVNFFVEDKRVRFEINPDSTERAGLKISAKMMSLAKVVKSGQK